MAGRAQKRIKGALGQKSLPVIYVVWLQHARLGRARQWSGSWVWGCRRLRTRGWARTDCAGCWLRRCDQAKQPFKTPSCTLAHGVGACECRRSPPLRAQPVCFVNSRAVFVSEHFLAQANLCLINLSGTKISLSTVIDWLIKASQMWQGFRILEVDFFFQTLWHNFCCFF